MAAFYLMADFSLDYGGLSANLCISTLFIALFIVLIEMDV